jgi:alkaline phosphatase
MEHHQSTIKNIILMISDGWSYNHIQAASYYQYGHASTQIYNFFPFRLMMSTNMTSSNGKECFIHEYNPTGEINESADFGSNCTDSAAAATAMSTGVKTYGGAIGVDLQNNRLKHALEYAKECGKSTGVVTSVEISHATPAGFIAHNQDRNNYEEIAREIIYHSSLDVLMGAGHPWYDADGNFDQAKEDFKYVGGEDTWFDLLSGNAGKGGNKEPWTLIQTRQEFQTLLNGSTPNRVIGIPQVDYTLQQGRSGDECAGPFVEPSILTVPTFQEMTSAALNVLGKAPAGMFLVVESGAVDWASHENQSGRMIEEQIAFDNVVETVVSWVEQNSNWQESLLIVTGDHECGYLTGPGSNGSQKPLVNNGRGKLPGMEWHSRGHSTSLIPIFANGSGAGLFEKYTYGHDPVHGQYIDNTDIAKVVFEVMSG